MAQIQVFLSCMQIPVSPSIGMAAKQRTRMRITDHRLSQFASRQFVQLEWDGTEIQ